MLIIVEKASTIIFILIQFSVNKFGPIFHFHFMNTKLPFIRLYSHSTSSKNILSIEVLLVFLVIFFLCISNTIHPIHKIYLLLFYLVKPKNLSFKLDFKYLSYPILYNKYFISIVRILEIPLRLRINYI